MQECNGVKSVHRSTDAPIERERERQMERIAVALQFGSAQHLHATTTPMCFMDHRRNPRQDRPHWKARPAKTRQVDRCLKRALGHNSGIWKRQERRDTENERTKSQSCNVSIERIM